MCLFVWCGHPGLSVSSARESVWSCADQCFICVGQMCFTKTCWVLLHPYYWKNAILRLPRGSDLASMYVAPKLNSTKYSHTCVWPLHWHTCVFEVESWRCLWPRVDLSRLWSGSRLFFSHSTTLARPLQCMVRTIVYVIVSHVVEKLVQWVSIFQSG